MELETKLKQRETNKQQNKIKKAEKKSLFKSFFNISINKVLKKMLSYPFLKSFLMKDTSSLILKNYILKSNKIKKDYNILFLSDSHLEIIDNTLKIKELLFEKRYDLIILGGDYYDSDKGFVKEKERFENLLLGLRGHSEMIISVAGNHDDNNVISFLQGETTFLLDDFLFFDDLLIYGAEESVTFDSDIEDKISFDSETYEDKYKICVSHNPIENKHGLFDIVLSGHTHGGQVSILGFAPINNCKLKSQIYGEWNGKFGKGITTSGVGCSGVPVRRGIKPELVEIKIKKED